jgi:hypothetical protein
MKKLMAKTGMALCDFGLWIISLGPKDAEDRYNEKELIKNWKYFKNKLSQENPLHAEKK